MKDLFEVNGMGFTFDIHALNCELRYDREGYLEIYSAAQSAVDTIVDQIGLDESSDLLIPVYELVDKYFADYIIYDSGEPELDIDEKTVIEFILNLLKEIPMREGWNELASTVTGFYQLPNEIAWAIFNAWYHDDYNRLNELKNELEAPNA